MISHSESCKYCKKKFFEFLCAIYGDVKREYDVNIPAKLMDYKNEKHFDILSEIYGRLCSYRGYNDFVKIKKIRPCDFYVMSENRIIELDEGQHFTKARSISLQCYEKIDLGFDIKRWISLCDNLNRHDNNPENRDEQRAWYDSLRDYASLITNGKPTIRVFSKEYVWCSMNVNDESIDKFKRVIAACVQEK